MGLARHVALVGRQQMHTEFWCGNLEVRGHFEDIGIYLRIILKWVLNRIGGCGLD
jgi:hypothetical protein